MAQLETSGIHGSRSPSDFRVLLALHGLADPHASLSHALALTVAAGGGIEIVDVGDGRGEHLRVRDVLQHWGMLPEGSERQDVGRLGIRVKKIVRSGNEGREVGKRLERSDHDLLVIGTGRNEGALAFLRETLTVYLVRRYRKTTLYLPEGAAGFVDRDTGAVSLHRILFAVAEHPAAAGACMFLEQLASLVPETAVEVVGVHVGTSFPPLNWDLPRGWSWRREVIAPAGRPVWRHVTEQARRFGADLVVTATNGRDTLMQRIVGSVTEQVLNAVPCPLLAVAVE